MSAPVTLITGTRKGIGKFLAGHYCEQGHIVYGCSRSEPEWKMEGYTHVLADVADEKQVKAIFSTIRRQHDGLDNLLNNAGIVIKKP